MRELENSRYILFKVTALILGFVTPFQVWGRPEYALKLGNNRCTSCHYSPAGGGPRNLSGKLYGAHAFPMHSLLEQGLAGADIKFLHYAPAARQDEVNDGLVNMASMVWASIPITPEKPIATESGSVPEGWNQRIVAEYGLGGLGNGSRNLYFLASQHNDTVNSWLPQQVLFGRFIPPFGIMTDEHRTYVRMQTATTWNAGMRTGVLMSSNPVDSVHYDLAILNGQENRADAMAKGQSHAWGGILNLRWMPSAAPILLGLSGDYYSRLPGEGDRSARAVYFGLSLERLTNQFLPMNLWVEYAEAHNWNKTTWTYAFASQAFADGVVNADSKGIFAVLNYDFARRWSLIYKYDYLLMDKDFTGDAFQRYGIGVKHWIGPNMWLAIRYDKSVAAAPSEQNSLKTGSLDSFWGVISFGL